MANRELVENGCAIIRLIRQARIRQFDARKITLRDLLPAGRPACKVRKFDVEQRALKPIHAEVSADDVMIVTPV